MIGMLGLPLASSGGGVGGVVTDARPGKMSVEPGKTCFIDVRHCKD